MSVLIGEQTASTAPETTHSSKLSPSSQPLSWPKTCAKKSIDYATRYNVFELALSDFDGTSQFNVAAHYDWGVSSLLEFSEGLEQTWPGRWDFYVDRKIEVKVSRFDTWFEAAGRPVEKIDFFHCDTQGTDLKVLQGMGEYFRLILDGVIEVPQSDAVKLYKDQHLKEHCYDFFSDMGYEVYDVRPQPNEDNLYFRPIR